MKKIFMLLLPLLCVLGSCEKDPGRMTGDPEGKAVEFRFATPVSSRAKVVDDALGKLDVLVFKRNPAAPDDPAQSTFLYARYAWKVSGGAWRTNLKIDSHLDIYFAANAHGLVAGLVEGASPALAEGKSFSEAQKLFLLQSPGEAIGADGLPMWGYLYDKTLEDKPLNDFGTVYLLRAVASADVRMLAANFTLQQGWLAYAADRGYLPFSPSNTTASSGGGFTANAPEVPASMSSASTPDWGYTLEAADNNNLEGVFYMYENDAPVNSANKSSKLVLKGIWNDPAGSGQPTYYPLALKSEDANGKMVKSQVVRNNKYILVITNVNGDGWPTLDDAKDAEDVNMDYQVIEWNDQMDDGIIIDGPSYVMLKRERNEKRDDRTAVTYRGAGTSDVIAFATNIPLEKFVMQLSGGGDFPDPADKRLIENGRFRVEIKEDSGNTWFEFTSLLAYGTTDNPSTLTVTAGRIKFEIEVIQRDFDSRDWNDGGEIDRDL